MTAITGTLACAFFAAMSAAQAGSDGKLYSGTIDPVPGAGAGALMVEVAAGAVVAGAVAVAPGAVVVAAPGAVAVTPGTVVLAAPEEPPLPAPDAPAVAVDFGWFPPVAVKSAASSPAPASSPPPHPEPAVPTATTASARNRP